MKNLQWFPGHMAKAMREMKDIADVCGGIIYVLDARCPAASYNPALKSVFKSKPVLYVLNKGDLADGKADVFLKKFRENGEECVKINAADSRSKRYITGAIENLMRESRLKSEAKGINAPYRLMVCGVPNTGKSSVINLLAGGARAATGNKAGVTRGKQWIRLGGYELLDTPGVTPPSFSEPRLAVRLAYVGSLNDDVLDRDEIALSLLKELWEKYPDLLAARYGIGGGEPLEMLTQICAHRGFVLRGNDYDYDRAINALIDDFRKGRIGKITLDEISDCSVFGWKE